MLENGQMMDLIEAGFIFALLLCVGYASMVGGRTGRLGSAIFVAAATFTALATTVDPTWASTSYAVFAVDGGCLLALAALAVHSNRFWPIWAVGFQTVAVATHMATIWIPDLLPKAYQALLSFWSIPILWVMVAGTRKDWNYEKANRPAATTPG
jgi:hypothetical protein